MTTEETNNVGSRKITIGDLFIPNTSKYAERSVFWKSAKYLFVSEMKQSESNIRITIKNESGHKMETNLNFVSALIDKKLLIPIKEEALTAKLFLSN